jgi:hypothetical protein
MQFEAAPAGITALGLSTTELLILAIVLPLIIGTIVGLRREFTVIAACAGVIAAVAAGAA